MQQALQAKYGDQWQAMLSSSPGAFQGAMSATPDDDKSQLEMDRIYRSGDDRIIGSIHFQGSAIAFNRSMIEPV
jgi:hypothetical protein